MIKPILFNTEMVRVILDGHKTCTRQVVKKVPEGTYQIDAEVNGDSLRFFATYGKLIEGGTADLYTELKPPYQVGDVLYVRETWGEGYKEGTYIYKADDKLANHPMFKESTKMLYHPSIHMPKEATRIWLRVTDVRVERLQDITEESAEEEGYRESVGSKTKFRTSATLNFFEAWDSTIKKSNLERYGWDANPWVWVIEFERCEKPLEAK